MCSLCCLCTYPATPISNRPPAMCGQHEPPVRPAAPRFESRRCDLCQSRGEDKPDFLRYLKVANRFGTAAQTLSGGNGARRWGDDNAPQRGPGAQPRHAFGSFRRETKGTPGVGRAGPLVGAGTTSPAKSPRGLGRSAQKVGRRDHVPASIPPGGEAPLTKIPHLNKTQDAGLKEL